MALITIILLLSFLLFCLHNNFAALFLFAAIVLLSSIIVYNFVNILSIIFLLMYLSECALFTIIIANNKIIDKSQNIKTLSIVFGIACSALFLEQPTRKILHQYDINIVTIAAIFSVILIIVLITTCIFITFNHTK